MNAGTTREALVVAMVIQSFHPVIGGAQGQLLSLGPHLRRRGVEAHVLTRRPPGTPRREVMGELAVHRLWSPPPRPLAAAAYITSTARRIAKLRPDVIHAFELLSPASAGVLAKRLVDAPLAVKVLRGGELGDLAVLEQRPFGRARLRAYQRHVDRFVVISDEIAHELEQAGIPRTRHAIVPNGVDTHRFSPATDEERRALRRELDLGPGPIGIFTGRLAPEKQALRLVHVWHRVQRVFPTAELVVLGDGPERNEIVRRELAATRVVGAVDDVAPWLKAADIFVLPSLAEGLSNSLLEAMATGLAVVATDVGAASGLIRTGESGLLVPSRDSDALESAILRLAGDPDLMRSLGDMARRVVVARFSLEAVADALVALYRSLARRDHATVEA